MSYPHIDPKTYLSILEHDIGRSPINSGRFRIFAVGSRAGVFCDMLRGIPASAINSVGAALRKIRVKKGSVVVSKRSIQS